MINRILKDIIRKVLDSRDDKHGWDTGAFKDIMKLPADLRGEIGEQLLERLLKNAGVPGVTRVGKLDRTKKQYDIKTKALKIEVKTSTIGRNSNMFQHDGIEKDRDYDVLVFVDITPDDVYITWIAKRDIPWKSTHRRAHGIQIKWDVSLKNTSNNKVKTVKDVKAGYNEVLKTVREDS